MAITTGGVISTSVLTVDAVGTDVIVAGGKGASENPLAPWPNTFTSAEPDTTDNVATVSYKFRNALFDYTNAYFNGVVYDNWPNFDLTDRTVAVGEPNPQQFQWKHFSSLFVNHAAGQDFKSFLGNIFLESSPNYPDTQFGAALQQRVLRQYGSGTFFPIVGSAYDNTVLKAVQTEKPNVGAMTNAAVTYANTQLVGDAWNYIADNGIDNDQFWCRHEWSQSVPILAADYANLTTNDFLKVGGQFRFDPRDPMRPKSFAGILVEWKVNNTAVKQARDVIVFRNSTQYPTKADLDLFEGTVSGVTTIDNTRTNTANFRGIAPPNDPSLAVNVFMSKASGLDTTITVRDVVDIADYSQFTEYNYNVPVPATYIDGEIAQARVSYFFAENSSYMTPDQIVNVDSLVIGGSYIIDSAGDTTQAQWLTITGTSVGIDVPIALIELNGTYTIKEVGDSDFTNLGAPNNDVGTAFIANRAGNASDGTGVASLGGYLAGKTFIAAASVSGTTGTAKPLTGSFDVFSPHVSLVEG
jgi:hypothetical protein